MQKKLSIYVITHKKTFIPKCDVLLPLQVGCSINRMHIDGYLHDDDGDDNISALNAQFCEMTGIYWIWKNDVHSRYIGIFHYRRYLNLSNVGFNNIYTNWKKFYTINALTQKKFDHYLFDKEVVDKLLHKYDLIYPTKSNLRERNINSFGELYSYGDKFTKELDYTIKLTEIKYPEYKQAIEKCTNAPYGYHCNMFIMKRSLFLEYAEFVFSVLGEVYNDITCGKLMTEKERLMGYLAEYLTGVFITYKEESCRIKNLDGAYFNYIDGKKHVIGSIKNIILCTAISVLVPNNSKRRKFVYKVMDVFRNGR